jgi:hypothetical protein
MQVEADGGSLHTAQPADPPLKSMVTRADTLLVSLLAGSQKCVMCMPAYCTHPQSSSH